MGCIKGSTKHLKTFPPEFDTEGHESVVFNEVKVASMFYFGLQPTL